MLTGIKEDKFHKEMNVNINENLFQRDNRNNSFFRNLGFTKKLIMIL
jgi:hypothetical protein